MAAAALDIYLPERSSFLSVPFRAGEAASLLHERARTQAGYADALLDVNGVRVARDEAREVDYFRAFGGPWVLRPDTLGVRAALLLPEGVTAVEVQVAKTATVREVVGEIERKAGKGPVDARHLWWWREGGDLSKIDSEDDRVPRGGTLFYRPPAAGGKIFVRTLARRVTELEVRWADSIEFVKILYCDKDGTAVDQQRYIYAQKLLADERSLSDYNVEEGATLDLVLRLRGGGTLVTAVGVGFADVSSAAGTTKVTLAGSAPKGRVVDIGTNIEAYCACTPYRVISRVGTGTFDLVRDAGTVRCPNCRQTGVRLETVGFLQCEYRTHGMKIGAAGLERHESAWRTVAYNDQYQLFDTDGNVGKVNWTRLVIESRALGSREPCTICLEPVPAAGDERAGGGAGCAHAFHAACLAGWRAARKNDDDNNACPCCSSGM